VQSLNPNDITICNTAHVPELVAALRDFIVESKPKFTLTPQSDIQGWLVLDADCKFNLSRDVYTRTHCVNWSGVVW
jgi:hypothetical protein